MKKYMVFMDAETDGLYGSFISVGMVVLNRQNEEVERAYYGMDKAKLKVTDPWVQENVLPILGEYEPCNTEEELLEKTWAFWMKYQDDAYAVADVEYPVECRLFEACVKLDFEERRWKAPFPFLDLSSMLYAKGLDPLTEREKLLDGFGNGKQHNALYDATLSAEIWKKYFRRETNGNN